jgi:hypothetical protein
LICLRTQFDSSLSNDTGGNVADDFETAIKKIQAKDVVIIAFSFGKEANEVVARTKLHEALEICLVTILELIGGMEIERRLSALLGKPDFPNQRSFKSGSESVKNC